VSEKANLSFGGQPFAARKDLQRNIFALNLDHLRQGQFPVPVLDNREVAESYIGCADREDIPDNRDHFGVTQQFLDHDQSPSSRLVAFSSWLGGLREENRLNASAHPQLAHDIDAPSTLGENGVGQGG
jgi:hypothetical protein